MFIGIPIYQKAYWAISVDKSLLAYCRKGSLLESLIKSHLNMLLLPDRIFQRENTTKLFLNDFTSNWPKMTMIGIKGLLRDFKNLFDRFMEA